MSLQMKVAKSEFAGDPGLFGFLGKVGQSLIGSIPGVGPVAQAGFKALKGKGKRAGQVTRVPGLRGRAQRFFPGGATGFEVRGAGQVGTQLACPRGFHPNKSDYYTSEGYVAEGTKCVRDRRRNPLNPGAASKAISRISAAKRATRALGRVTIRKSCD